MSSQKSAQELRLDETQEYHSSTKHLIQDKVSNRHRLLRFYFTVISGPVTARIGIYINQMWLTEKGVCPLNIDQRSLSPARILKNLSADIVETL